VFEAPRELVFRAWTESIHIAQWWGPTGFRTTIYEMNVRPGRVWRFVMHGPDGRDELKTFREGMVFLEKGLVGTLDQLAECLGKR
jgi:uncharacterized protein YndB with AHSA1/START domain